jgi:hypothetical protein
MSIGRIAMTKVFYNEANCRNYGDIASNRVTAWSRQNSGHITNGPWRPRKPGMD